MSDCVVAKWTEKKLIAVSRRARVLVAPARNVSIFVGQISYPQLLRKSARFNVIIDVTFMKEMLAGQGEICPRLCLVHCIVVVYLGLIFWRTAADQSHFTSSGSLSSLDVWRCSFHGTVSWWWMWWRWRWMVRQHPQQMRTMSGMLVGVTWPIFSMITTVCDRPSSLCGETRTCPHVPVSPLLSFQKHRFI